MNPYFSVLPLTANTVARAADINVRFAGVQAGFDKLPDPVKLAQNRVTYVVDTGTASAMVVTLSPAPTAYVDGMELTVKVAATSTTSSTINVNGLGAVAVRRTGGTITEAGDFLAGQIVKLVYDSAINGFRLMGASELVILSHIANAEAAAEQAALYAVGADSFKNEAAASAADAYASVLLAQSYADSLNSTLLLSKADNLASLVDKEASRTNLGLKAMATRDKASATEIAAMTADKGITADTLATALTFVPVTYGATTTIDMAAGSNFRCTMTGNATLTLSNVIVGKTIEIELLGDSGTTRSVALSTNFKGSIPILSDITSTKGYALTIKAMGATQWNVVARQSL